MTLQWSADQVGDNSLNRKVLILLDDDWWGSRVVATENDEDAVLTAFDGQAFERGQLIDEAGTDAPLHVLGFHVRPVLYENQVAGFERRLHGVEAEP